MDKNQTGEEAFEMFIPWKAGGRKRLEDWTIFRLTGMPYSSYVQELPVQQNGYLANQAE